MSSASIADYGLISDCQSAALVSRDASIDWCCMPRLDRASCFGRLLDDGGGHWSISPAADLAWPPRRAYRDDSMVLDTTLAMLHGDVRVTDCFILPAPR